MKVDKRFKDIYYTEIISVTEFPENNPLAETIVFFYNGMNLESQIYDFILRNLHTFVREKN